MFGLLLAFPPHLRAKSLQLHQKNLPKIFAFFQTYHKVEISQSLLENDSRLRSARFIHKVECEVEIIQGQEKTRQLISKDLFISAPFETSI